MRRVELRKCTLVNVREYGRIYAAAFAGEPWNDPWKTEDAEIHVKEQLELRQSYGLEYRMNDKIMGFILGTSTLFHRGRIFEIHDLAVDPDYQGQGIAKELLAQCLKDIKAMGMTGAVLITATSGRLPSFYQQAGFKEEREICIMGMEF